ncbi:MAG: HdeD family acid-resistance protein [Vicinamibacterales bacterium]
MGSISDFLRTATNQWRWVALRGVIAIALGMWAFLYPAITLTTLVLVWGAYALADGAFALIAAWRTRDHGGPFWSYVLVGLAGLVAGVLTFMWPGLTTLVLIAFIASWAIVMGVLQIVAAIRLRKEIHGELWLALSGVLSVMVGAYFLLAPDAGALAIVWMLGAYALIFGGFLLAFAFRLRRLRRARLDADDFRPALDPTALS